METAVQQCSIDKQCFEIHKKYFFLDNDRLLHQIISQDVMLIVMHSSTAIFDDSMNLEMKKSESCNKCLDLEAELVKKKNMVERDVYTELSNRFARLEKHCISLELDIQLNQQNFQKDKSCENQNAQEFLEFFENSDLKTQLQEKDTTINKLRNNIKSLRESDKKDRVKQNMNEIETINIELEHKVAKLLSENELLHKEIEHLKKIYIDHFDSIKKTRALSKEQWMFKLDLDPLAPRFLKNKDAHLDYFKYTQEQADILQGIVNVHSKSKSAKNNNKQNTWKPTGKVFTEIGYWWKPTGRTFTLVGNSCPLTRLTYTKVVPHKETTSHSVETKKPEFKIYSRRPKQVKSLGSSKKAKIIESRIANNSKPNHSWGSNATDVLSSSSLVNDRLSDCSLVSGLQILRTYDMEPLSAHELRSKDTNLYTISLDDMLKTSPICLLLKASKTKSWLWHCRLSYLNFGTLNQLAKDCLARGIPKLKFKKDHMCSACALGKSKKASHQPKAKDTNQQKLYLLYMDLCGPMHVERINRKKYILVIVDKYSRFNWVKFLRSKDEAPDAIIKCIKNIQFCLNATVRNVRTYNGTQFVNQTL
ncbi:retrovirus-related pol polyprotein from transposon TNT 1-94 [Tanacetum coccineum]